MINPARLPKKLLTGFNKDTINQLIDFCHSLLPMETPDFKPDFTTQGWKPRIIHPPSSIGAAFDTWTYMGYRFKSSTILTVKARAAVFHSMNLTGNIAQQDVNLSGSVVWIYAIVDRRSVGSTTIPLAISSSRPASDQTFANVVLYRFDLSGVNYYLGHCGWWDFNFDLPLANT